MECWEMETNTFRCQSQSLVSGNVVSKSCCKEGMFCEEITVWLLTRFARHVWMYHCFSRCEQLIKIMWLSSPPCGGLVNFRLGDIKKSLHHGEWLGATLIMALYGCWLLVSDGFLLKKGKPFGVSLGMFIFCNDIYIYRIPLKINGWNLTIILFWQGTSSEPNLNFYVPC